MNDGGAYVGTELQLFANATNWKAYMRNKLQPYISGSVAEVGAGIGATTANLCDPSQVVDWLCIEPDPAQSETIRAMIRRGDLPDCCSVQTGVLNEVDSHRSFDTIIYIDVLEHIESHREEAQLAFNKLRPGGRMVVLGPAYPFLFSKFDEAVGHHRRYTLKSLRAVAPTGANEATAFYLDSLGLMMSLANKLFLKQGQPTPGQIETWDRLVVPASRLLMDKVTFHKAGRSAVIVWEKSR